MSIAKMSTFSPKRKGLSFRSLCLGRHTENRLTGEAVFLCGISEPQTDLQGHGAECCCSALVKPSEGGANGKISIPVKLRGKRRWQSGAVHQGAALSAMLQGAPELQVHSALPGGRG